MSQEKSLRTYRIVSAGAFLSGLIGLDLLLSFFCAGFPLFMYLLVGGLGAWSGRRLRKRLSGTSFGARFGRKLGIVLACFSACGIVLQFALPVNWDTHCAWRHCGRAMGPSLTRSPFPVGTPSCSAWHKCANEYPFTPSQYDAMSRRMERQGCAAP